MEMVEGKVDENFGPYEDTREVGRATWMEVITAWFRKL